MGTRLRRKGDSGLKLWHGKVRKTYDSLEELEHYDSIYGTAARCGYESPTDLWKANPMLQGSVNPGDFGVALHVTLRPRTVDEVQDSLWESTPWILEPGDGVLIGYKTEGGGKAAMKEY